MKKHILLTGASGFVGKVLLPTLRNKGYTVIPVYRQAGKGGFRIDSLSADTDWCGALENTDVVIHTAARVHVMSENADNPLYEFRKVNVDGTLKLAREAASAGVKRFIYLSSIKVNGESTDGRAPFSADEECHPSDPYSISKKEAEDNLLALAQETGMEVVIIRPPLIYGPGVRANFQSMMSWLKKGIPLPLGSIDNQRSLVSVYNLIDLILACINHPGAADQIFLVSDDMDMSIPELLNRLSKALGCRALLVPFPKSLLVLGLSLLGRGALAQRLCGSLQVDITKNKELLGWRPPVTVDEGLVKTAQTSQLN
ncbi:SDR family oxidoreductase [Microbulbifer sp. GL-2]|uniref:UDP-glucose 4-epimerase family protein n=1 Tax=Microbulbifer sp. GL-2 TaxID=2591606 RepID=UPI001165145D|nr:SDR family oxidoreductase [Microbulbifer sp. GL-2]BBM03810.1 UDP-glucose 4-epimerase [Microbulbifer sp. GL-2]